MAFTNTQLVNMTTFYGNLVIKNPQMCARIIHDGNSAVVDATGIHPLKLGAQTYKAHDCHGCGAPNCRDKCEYCGRDAA